MTTLIHNIQYAFRQLRKSPGFTSVAILTLGLCIGANLTIFAILDTILVRALPFPEPERLVVVHNVYPGVGIEKGKASIANFFERRESIEAFESVSLYRERFYTIGESDSTRRVLCAEVTPEFFETLGVRLALGESFADAHFDYDGANLVAVLTDRYWRQYYNADPEVVGRSIIFNSNNARVIGVLPPEFRYLNPQIEIYRPLAHHRYVRTSPGRHSEHARTFDGQMVARLGENRSIVEAQTQLRILNEQWLSADPMGKSIKHAGYHASVAPLHVEHVRSVRPLLLLVQTGVLFLLLIGGINLASLQLIRASARAKETATRKALGASRWSIAGTILPETMMISLAGGGLGVLIAVAGIRLVRWLGAARLPLGADITFDHRVALAAMVASLVVGVCTAIPIIWINLRASPQLCLQSETRSGTVSLGIQRLRHAYLVTQIAMAFVLLSGAGLLGTSLKRMLAEPRGFTSEQVLTAQITLPWMTYRGPGSKLPFVRRLLEDVKTLPGVTQAAISSALPFTTEGSLTRSVLAEGTDASAGANLRAHYFSYVTSDYWRTMGIPLLKGRFFDDSDIVDSEARHIAIIDKSVAQQYWPNGDAIGRRLTTALSEFDVAQVLTVVGIVGSVKQTDLSETEVFGAIYQPYSFSTDFRLLVRASIPVNTLIPSIRKSVRAIDPAMPIGNFKSLQTYIDDSLVTRRSPAILAGIFAGVALLLAAMGTYGVLAYAVAQRRREIGVRVALGAMPTQISFQFLLLGFRLLVVGSLIGCFGAWAAGRAMQSILFQVPSFHLAIFIGTGFVLGLVTLSACLLPALRAARTDPMEALRYE